MLDIAYIHILGMGSCFRYAKPFASAVTSRLPSTQGNGPS